MLHAKAATKVGTQVSYSCVGSHNMAEQSSELCSAQFTGIIRRSVHVGDHRDGLQGALTPVSVAQSSRVSYDIPIVVCSLRSVRGGRLTWCECPGDSCRQRRTRRRERCLGVVEKKAISTRGEAATAKASAHGPPIKSDVTKDETRLMCAVRSHSAGEVRLPMAAICGSSSVRFHPSRRESRPPHLDSRESRVRSAPSDIR
eukprot:scaffold48_cov311-Pinguiococcus_pyrenoidosus.AAC.81